jgi:hypothetical protein
MSCRHWIVKAATASAGEYVEVCRDCESKSYRLFLYCDGPSFRGITSSVVNERGCVDMSVEQLRELARQLLKAADAHEPWPDYD